MGRVSALPQLVPPKMVLVTLLVMVLGCSAMPRTGGPIVFREDRFGTGWGRFGARTPQPVSTRIGLVDGEDAQSTQHAKRLIFPSASIRQTHRLGRPELPPRPRWQTKTARRMITARKRAAGSSSAIIFPGQEGHELPWAPRISTKKPTMKSDKETTAVDFADNPKKATPMKEALEKDSPSKGTSSREDGLAIPECDGVAFRALDVHSGVCRSLAMRSGCGAGQWFVLDRNTHQAACRQHPCDKGFAMLNGTCHDLSDSSVCGPNMVLQVDEFGDASCDCEKGCIYWQAENRCYPALMRGPCSEGQQLTVDADGAACVENVCGRDGLAPWPGNGQCYPLQDDRNAPCQHGRMEVDPWTLELVCIDAVANSVFSTPSVRCAVGSRRALGGRCKRSIRVSSGSQRGHFGVSRCSAGYIETPDGGCRRRSTGGFGGLG